MSVNRVSITPKLSENPQYETYSGGSGMNTPFKLPAERPSWSTGTSTPTPTPELPKEEKIINTSCGEYTFLYKSVNRGTYTLKRTGYEFYLYMKADTGDYVGFTMDKNYYTVHEQNLPDLYPEQEILILADQYVSKFIDVNDYIRTHKVYSSDKICRITYTKYYNGIKTGETMEISITPKGTIIDFHYYNIGGFDKMTADIDIEAATQAAIDKMISVSKYTITGYSLREQSLNIDSSGQVTLTSIFDFTAEGVIAGTFSSGRAEANMHTLL